MARILFIDDDPFVLGSSAVALRRAGHEVSSEAEARSALRKLAEQSFDLLITDIIMPDMDGYELIREIHALQPDLPILAQSGCQAAMGHATLRIAGLLGASRCLVKPYSLSELLEAVDQLVGTAATTH